MLPRTGGEKLYLINIGGEDLRQQRQWLINQRELHASQGSEADLEIIEGLLGLTDDIADQAYDLHGIDGLLMKGIERKRPGPLGTIAINVYGGLAQDVLAPEWLLEHVDILVVDHDVDAGDDDGLTRYTDVSGREEVALVGPALCFSRQPGNKTDLERAVEAYNTAKAGN